MRSEFKAQAIRLGQKADDAHLQGSFTCLGAQNGTNQKSSHPSAKWHLLWHCPRQDTELTDQRSDPGGHFQCSVEAAL